MRLGFCRKTALKGMNMDFEGRVYTSKTGDIAVSMKPDGMHGGRRFPTRNTGWRARANGERELVHWKNNQWMTDEEINTVRVTARTF